MNSDPLPEHSPGLQRWLDEPWRRTRRVARRKNKVPNVVSAEEYFDGTDVQSPPAAAV